MREVFLVGSDGEHNEVRFGPVAVGHVHDVVGYPDIAVEIVDSRTVDGRIQLLENVPTVLSGPPGSGPT